LLGWCDRVWLIIESDKLEIYDFYNDQLFNFNDIIQLCKGFDKYCTWLCHFESTSKKIQNE
jgi:hypothetical protein